MYSTLKVLLKNGWTTNARVQRECSHSLLALAHNPGMSPVEWVPICCWTDANSVCALICTHRHTRSEGGTGTRRDIRPHNMSSRHISLRPHAQTHTHVLFETTWHTHTNRMWVTKRVIAKMGGKAACGVCTMAGLALRHRVARSSAFEAIADNSQHNKPRAAASRVCKLHPSQTER